MILDAVRARTFSVAACLAVLTLGCGMWNQPCAAAEYLGPTTVAASPDGDVLYVLEADADRIDVVTTDSPEVARSIAVPEEPHDLTLGTGGQRLYVTAGVAQGVVAEIDTKSGETLRTFAAGHTPSGLALSPDGTTLYVCNRFNNDVSVIDVDSGETLARVDCIREPIKAAITPDGSTVFVSNHLPLDRGDSYDVAAEITWIDTASRESGNIRLLNGTTSLRGLAVSPDGKYLFAVHVLARYQMPTTQLERGWMNTNAMTIIDVASREMVNTVLLDDVDLGAAIPHAVACSSDGKKVFVTTASTDELIVIDVPGMMEKLASLPDDPEAVEDIEYDGSQSSFVTSDVPNDLSFLVGLKERMSLTGTPLYAYTLPSGEEPLIKGARGLAVIGNRVFVPMYFSDVLAVVDLEKSPYQRLSHVALGPTPEWTLQRRGEVFFFDAALCFQHWQSCGSCHPDARTDGLNWDLLNDGLGTPKNNKSLLLAHETPPAMWEGVRADAEAGVRAGIRHIQFAVRPEEDAQAIDAYLKSLEPVPSPYLVDGQLSEAAQRGRELFFSEEIGCAKCHPEPLYTDMKMHNVGSQGKFDRSVEFDTPTLIEVWRTAPYMHDGHYLTIEELIHEGRHGEQGGNIDGLTEEQLHDLAEFVRSL